MQLQDKVALITAGEIHGIRRLSGSFRNQGGYLCGGSSHIQPRIGKTILQLFQASIGESMRTIPLQALSDHRRILQAFIKKDEQELICAVENSFQGWASVMAREACDPAERFFALFVFAQLLFFGRSEDLAIRKIGKAGAKKFYV